MNVLTATGNPILNEKLKELDEVIVVGKDIQYQEGVIEILEENLDIDCLIINKELPGEVGFYKLINKIKNIKENLDIYVFLKEKDEDIENYLMSYQIYKIYYLNEINYDDFIKNFFVGKKNILVGINKEINDFKKLILSENNNEDNYSFVEKVITESFNDSNYEKYNEKSEENPYKEEYDDFLKEENCKTITISGDFGCGKSLFSVFLSKVISRQNKKVLLIDFDLENMSINTLFGVKKYKEKQTYIEDCITKVNENLDILCGMDKIINLKETNNNYVIKEIIERLKKEYEFIIMDVSSRIDLKYVKIILTYSDKIIFLIEPNLLEISKANKYLEVFIKDFEIDVDKIKIVFNKINKYQIANTVLEEIFSEVEIIESIEYEERYNLFINKNTNIDFDEIKYERIYENLIKKEEGIYANSIVRN